MGDASHGMMSRSVSTGVPRKNNSEEVAKRRAELQQKLEQRFVRSFFDRSLSVWIVEVKVTEQFSFESETK